MAKPVAGYLGYDTDADRPTVLLKSGRKRLLTEDDSGGGGSVDSVTGAGAIDVDNTDPANPVVSLDESELENGGAQEISIAGLSGLAADPQTVQIAKSAVLIGTRKRVNLIPASGITLTVADNSIDDRVDVTIAVDPQFIVSPATIASVIQPKSWWRADNTVQSGGLVDTIVDNGSYGKNMTQSGTPRCPTGTDANSQTYLALDGANDYYQAGATNDWKFLHDGTPNTIAIIMAQPTLATADQTIIGNVGFDPTVTGFELIWSYVSATQQGPSYAVARGTAATYVLFCEDRSLYQPIQVFIYRNAGFGLEFRSAGGTPGSGANTIQIRRNGSLRSTSYKNTGAAFNTGNPTALMALGARKTSGGTLTQYSSARIYDVIVDNKSWSDDWCLLFERYARGKGVIV